MENDSRSSPRKTLILPLVLIALGTGWLMTALGVAADVDWIWTSGLAVVGILTLIVGGVDKATVVAGPFFLAASALSVARQTGRLAVDLEVPILVIALGVLLLVARSPRIPTPSWILDASPRDRQD